MNRYDTDSAKISLNIGCDALKAIANAIEILTTINPPPERLVDNTLTALAAHAFYLQGWSIKSPEG